MRRSGRTTKMLIDMARYLQENFDNKENAILVSHRVTYSSVLLHRLEGLFPIKQANPFTYACGSISIHLASYDGLYNDPNRWKGMGNITVFGDHFNPVMERHHD